MLKKTSIVEIYVCCANRQIALGMQWRDVMNDVNLLLNNNGLELIESRQRNIGGSVSISSFSDNNRLEVDYYYYWSAPYTPALHIHN